MPPGRARGELVRLDRSRSRWPARASRSMRPSRSPCAATRTRSRARIGNLVENGLVHGPAGETVTVVVREAKAARA